MPNYYKYTITNTQYYTLNDDKLYPSNCHRIYKMSILYNYKPQKLIKITISSNTIRVAYSLETMKTSHVLPLL